MRIRHRIYEIDHLDKKTGEVVWLSDNLPKKKYNESNTSTGVDYATPVVYEHEGKRYVAVSSYEGLYCVEASTGRPIWFYNWETYSGIQVADPLIFNNKVLIIQYDNVYIGSVLLNVGGREPTVLWQNKDIYSEVSSPVLIDGYIYVCHGGPETSFGSLKCLDIETGDLMWEENLNKRPISLMAADKKLIIVDESGNLYIANSNPASYQEMSSCVLPGALPGSLGYRKYWTHPVLCKAKIYCRNGFGNLVCIDVSR